MSEDFNINSLGWQFENAFKLIGVTHIPYVPSVIHVACAARASSDERVFNFTYDEDAWYLDSALGFLKAIQGMVKDGYETSEEESALMAAIAKAAEEQTQETGEDEEAYQEPEVDASNGEDLDAVA
jgi:hypothetical protein